MNGERKREEYPVPYQIATHNGGGVAEGTHGAHGIRLECRVDPHSPEVCVRTYIILPEGDEFTTSLEARASDMVAGFATAWADAVARIDRLQKLRWTNP